MLDQRLCILSMMLILIAQLPSREAVTPWALTTRQSYVSISSTTSFLTLCIIIFLIANLISKTSISLLLLYFAFLYYYFITWPISILMNCLIMCLVYSFSHLFAQYFIFVISCGLPFLSCFIGVLIYMQAITSFSYNYFILDCHLPFSFVCCLRIHKSKKFMCSG